MCDVKNPLYGENGAAYVFAPQKGADLQMVKRLDNGLRHASEVIERELNIKDIAYIEGAGAAGGMGAGCIAFLGGKLKSGIESVLDMIEFDKLLENTDFVLTGEGRLDSQSVQGKVISGIAKRTKIRNIPLIALVGGIGDGAEQAYNLGVTAMFGIDRDASSFEQLAPKSALYYEKTLKDVLSVMKITWLKQ
ncbi:MAG TPA: glycerate kinase [Candidatus Butyricicoccus avistercoris]|uniref:Glycerate kinase n=1 Tax=Candidatus Butyricicoccus avistercoris TaxID=2838518 RepID=A0A9D1PGT5_9FIRM|nr:glycerate kinase [Candidatus Butyricicoccus avistercoris]